VRGDRWPAYATREAFALLCSYSGKTEETLALYREAAHRGVPRAATHDGGALAVACDRDGVPWHKLPPGSPPRAAMYAAWVAISHLVSSLEWGGRSRARMARSGDASARTQPNVGSASAEAQNPAKQLARALAGRFVFVYAGSERVGPVATRRAAPTQRKC
jgi:hypothetical protein